MLRLVDGCTREHLVLVADTPLPGQRVPRELGAIASERGSPEVVRNSTQVISNLHILLT